VMVFLMSAHLCWDGQYCLDAFLYLCAVPKFPQVYLRILWHGENRPGKEQSWVYNVMFRSGHVAKAGLLIVLVAFVWQYTINHQSSSTWSPDDWGQFPDFTDKNASNPIPDSRFSWCNVRTETEFAILQDRSKIVAAAVHFTTGTTMGLENVHSNVLINGHPFWLHAFFFNCVILIFIAVAVRLANPVPWGVDQWAYYLAEAFRSFGWFVLSAGCSTWLVRSYWYPQFIKATAGLSDGGADSRCQLGTGTGLGAHSEHAGHAVEDLSLDEILQVFTWDDTFCDKVHVGSQVESMRVPQASDYATSSEASTEPPLSSSCHSAEAGDEEDDTHPRPRKVQRFFETNMVITESHNASASDCSVNGTHVSLVRDVVTFPEVSTELLQSPSCPTAEEDCTQHQPRELPSFITKLIITESHCDTSPSDGPINSSVASSAAAVEPEPTFITKLIITESHGDTSESDGLVNTSVASSAATVEPEPDRVMSNANLTHLSHVVTSIPTQIEKSDVSSNATKTDAFDLAEYWINGLAAGPTPSWEQFKYQQQKARKRAQQGLAQFVECDHITPDGRKSGGVISQWQV